MALSRFIFAALTVAGLAACEGPAGPQGNANVVTGTFTLADADYVDGFWNVPVEGGTYSHQAKVAAMNVPAITSDIADDGLVLVYLRTPSTETGAPDQWTPLPFHQIGLFGGYLISVKAAYSTGTVRIGYLHEQTDTSVAVPSVYTETVPTYEFKYVAVAGEAAAQLATLPVRDYGAVTHVLAGRGMSGPR